MVDPDSGLGNNWSMFITVILLYTCIMTPYDLAFDDGVMYSSSWWTDKVIDLLFFTDMIIVFNTFYTCEETFENEYNRMKIACRYL